MQRLHGDGSPVPQKIVMTNVMKLVQQHMAQAAVIEAGLPIRREEDGWLADANEGGCGAGGREKDARGGDAEQRG